MINKILISTRNPGKVVEIQAKFETRSIETITLDEAGVPVDFDIEETGTTTKENAQLKAIGFANKTGFVTLADDSGLIVDALDGRPGVYSKRYGLDDLDRNSKLLKELENIVFEERTARFVTVLCLYNPQDTTSIFAEGVVEGYIALQMQGNQGFGYDPVFIPSEIAGNQTFAELGIEVKNNISHRARALQKMLEELSQLQT